MTPSSSTGSGSEGAGAAGPPAPHPGRDADLIAYYDHEVADRAARGLDPDRVSHRDAFVELLRTEGRTTVLEIGSGPGRDGLALVAAGLQYVGVDLSPGSVELSRAQGLDVRVASALALPLPAGAVDAVWTMSTLLHLDDAELATALSEIARVLRPGGLLALGLWADEESTEQQWEDGRGHGPPRYFRMRSDAEVRAAVESVGTVERFDCWPGVPPLHYQWVLVRAGGQPSSRS